jgi:hypothetical protein
MNLITIICNISDCNALHKIKLYDTYNLCPLSQKVLRLGQFQEKVFKECFFFYRRSLGTLWTKVVLMKTGPNTEWMGTKSILNVILQRAYKKHTLTWGANFQLHSPHDEIIAFIASLQHIFQPVCLIKSSADK